MKSLFIAFLLILTTQSFAQHEHHAKHNMVMFGDQEIFVSHLVYKVPHNYQVILKLHLDQQVLAEYKEARQSAPEDMMILLLDHMDISQISEASLITGTMLIEDKQGVRKEINKKVRINRADFEIIYFDEVPLILTK